jgi:hypothetical protein
MHDEFLHRLRKEPRPEFAMRLQARLRRQSRFPLGRRPPSWARTVVTLLLLGGTAFAFTAIVMRGFPTSWIELSRQAVVRVIGESTHTSEHGPGSDGIRKGPGWYPMNSGVGGGTTVRSEYARRANSATSAAATVTSPGVVVSAASFRDRALSGLQSGQTRVASSWSAYLYILPAVEQLNSARGANGIPLTPQIALFVRDSDRWPASICGSGPRAPDIAYAFEPFGSINNQPCPGKASGNRFSIVAFPVGYEAVALARSPLYGELDLTRREIFLALAKWVLDPRTGTIHENPNTTWRQVDSALGPEQIQFMGPPLSSPAGRSMIELLMEAGCRTFPRVAALKSTDPDRFARICRSVRTDGVYVEVSSLAPYRLLSEPNAVGIFALNGGFANEFNELAVSRLDGEAPTLQNIESGAYAGSRALYLYFRRWSVAPWVVRSLLVSSTAYQPDSALIPPSGAQFRTAAEAAGGH